MTGIHYLRTKIVATVGPASREPEVLHSLLRAGVDVVRLNFSHGDHDMHAETIARIRIAAQETGKPVAILADLQGPKLRVGDMGEGVMLDSGETISLTTDPITGRRGLVPIQYPELPGLVTAGEHILLDDGLLELEVVSVTENTIECQVVTGGLLTSKKGMNLPDASLNIPAITEKDRADLAFALEHDVDWIALSFVRTAAEVKLLKDMIRDQAPDDPVLVIAKIEKPQAVANIEEIVAAADGIMVARGDLGIEMPTEVVPMIQKRIIRICNMAGKPVITATQMLDSMIRLPRPTRAEASDVANAVLDGTDAVMLSGETAAGRYPVLTVQTMAHIVAEAEAAMQWGVILDQAPTRSMSTAEAVAHASCETARDLQSAAIITPTVSGSTARMVARFRPVTPIIAVTPEERTQRQLMLVWGIHPLRSRHVVSTDQLIYDAVQVARNAGRVRVGDTVIVTAGTRGQLGSTTDLMKVHMVSA